MERTLTNEFKNLVNIKKKNRSFGSPNTGMFNRGFKLPLKFNKSKTMEVSEKHTGHIFMQKPTAKLYLYLRM